MKAGGTYEYRPEWIDDTLAVRCSFCHDHPGARYDDGSGKCEACNGSAWIVLANREPAPAVREEGAQPNWTPQAEWTIYVCPGCGNYDTKTRFGAIVEHSDFTEQCAGPSVEVTVRPASTRVREDDEARVIPLEPRARREFRKRLLGRMERDRELLLRLEDDPAPPTLKGEGE